MNAIPMIDVESNQIHSIGHDATTNTLAIRFYRDWGADKKPGAIYHYANFTAADFAAFRDAESLGKHFGKHIKPETVKHPFTRINDTPAHTGEAA